jgi:hypothetical protein
MIDVKKLSIGFLILAVAGAASALFISNTGAFSGNGQAAIIADSAGASGGGAGAATLSGNAFAAQTAGDQGTDGVQLFGDDPLDGVVSATTTAAMLAPDNLTNILANSYMGNLMAQNPNGPVADASGDETLTPPDATSVIEQFLSSSTQLQAPTIPDWDAEAAEIPMVVVSSTPAALASYGTALSGILDQNVTQPNMEGVLANNSDPNLITYATGNIQETLQDVSSLKTPAAAVPLQKDLVKTLVYAKNLLALVQNGQIDPVKTELIMEAEDNKYQTALQDLQNDVQTAQSENLFAVATPAPTEPGPTGALAMIQSFVGIPVAHAQLNVFDPDTHVILWANVAELIKRDLEDIALQLVKNALVFIMQKTIIAGIQNSGAPRFVQQWGVTLANSLTASALNALNSQMQCTAGAPFQTQLRVTLGATYKPGNNNVCAVQFQSQLGNTLTGPGSFYNNFSNGGWLTFGSTMQPDDNYFGSAFFIAQAVGNTAQTQQTAQNAKSVASQGFSANATCPDGSDPNKGQTTICSNNANGNTKNYPGGSCPNGWTAQLTIPNDGFCTDGQEPQVQAPGAILSGMINNAVNGNFQLVSNASNWVGLASGLFISILQETMNSLAQTAIAGENGLLQQAYNGGGATSVNTSTLTVTSGASSPQPITCYVTPDSSSNSSTFVDDVLLSGGETISSNGATTPSYTWTPPAGITISNPTTGSFTATAVAAGTYGVFIQESPDNSSTTCPITFPAPSE